MNIPEETLMLRIYVSSTDAVRHTPVHEAVAYAARRYGMAGCTVYKGLMGFGWHTRLMSPKFWEITEKVPVIIEIMDTSERIETFLEKISCWLDRLPHGCLACTQPVRICSVGGSRS